MNFCWHNLVGPPQNPGGKKVDKEWILNHGIGNMQIPLDLGSFRKIKMKAEGSSRNNYVVDVVMNRFMVDKFAEDAFCNACPTFRPYMSNV